MFEALFEFHLDLKEVIVVFLELPSGNELVIEDMFLLFETPQ